MKLSVIVPCYNEYKSLNELHSRLIKRFNKEKISYEIIMIDDGSTDDTLSTIKSIIEIDSNVKLVSFSRNFGKEAAMLAGLRKATGEYTIFVDADLQQTEDTIMEMYNKLIENPSFDIVSAYNEDNNNSNKLKKVLTSIFYKIINTISEVKLLPGASDFRIFKSNVREALISLPEKNRFTKGIFSWIGFNTIYIPYKPNKREHGTTKWSIHKLVKYALDGIVAFSALPINVIFILSVFLFLVMLLNFIVMGNLGFRSVLLLLGFIVLSIGILGLYILRMYANSLNRPYYIIKEEIGFKNKK